MITTITGENNYLLQSELQKRVRKFVDQYGDLALEQLDAAEVSYERITEAMQSLPFLASSKLLIIKDFTANKQLLENIEHIFDTVAESTDVILVAAKIDKRGKAYKYLKANTEFVYFGLLEEGGLVSWLTKTAEDCGGGLSPGNARRLIDRVGVDQTLLDNELQKLLIYNPQITQESINELCEPLPQSTVFELLDAAFGGRQARAMQLYADQRQQRIEPLAILGMIGWQLHILAVVATAKGQPTDAIAREAKLHPFVVRKNLELASNLSLTKLKTLIHKALALDIRLKSTSINADDALRQYLLAI